MYRNLLRGWLGVSYHSVSSCWAHHETTSSYEGSYPVLNRLSDVTYSVDPATTPWDRRTKLADNVHVIGLKACLLPYSSFPTTSTPEGSVSTGGRGSWSNDLFWRAIRILRTFSQELTHEPRAGYCSIPSLAFSILHWKLLALSNQLSPCQYIRTLSGTST